MYHSFIYVLIFNDTDALSVAVYKKWQQKVICKIIKWRKWVTSDVIGFTGWCNGSKAAMMTPNFQSTSDQEEESLHPPTAPAMYVSSRLRRLFSWHTSHLKALKNTKWKTMRTATFKSLWATFTLDFNHKFPSFFFFFPMLGRSL